MPFLGRARAADQRLSDRHAARAPFGRRQAVVPYHPEGSYIRTKVLTDCFRCHDGKTEHERKIVSRKCETCHLHEKISNALLFN